MTQNWRGTPWDWANVACPTCWQKAGEQCRTTSTRKVTYPHHARLERSGWLKMQDAVRRSRRGRTK